MLDTVNTFLEHWYPFYWSIIFLIEMGVAIATLYWVKREFDYDRNKDLEKKQRRTKTTKKVTTEPGGVSTTEETTEVTEPTNEENKKA